MLPAKWWKLTLSVRILIIVFYTMYRGLEQFVWGGLALCNYNLSDSKARGNRFFIYLCDLPPRITSLLTLSTSVNDMKNKKIQSTTCNMKVNGHFRIAKLWSLHNVSTLCQSPTLVTWCRKVSQFNPACINNSISWRCSYRKGL